MKKKKLLIVDDEEEFRELARVAAERVGFDVTDTSNATDFKRAFKSQEPTTVLLDVIMPETDGVELIQWLATQKCRASIVVATGYSENYTEMIQKLGDALGLESISILRKPASISDLRRAITANNE